LVVEDETMDLRDTFESTLNQQMESVVTRYLALLTSSKSVVPNADNAYRLLEELLNALDVRNSAN
jgi:hypothetical protein